MVYLDICGTLKDMVKIEDLRVCMECGTVFAKKPSSLKLILKCPNCNSIRRRPIATHEKSKNSDSTDWRCTLVWAHHFVWIIFWQSVRMRIKIRLEKFTVKVTIYNVLILNKKLMRLSGVSLWLNIWKPKQWNEQLISSTFPS